MRRCRLGRLLRDAATARPGPHHPAFCTTPDEIRDFIAYAVAHYNVDAKRVYLTGLSCGGFGAWEYLAKYRDEQVAAAVPIAAEGRPALATAGCGLGDVAIWAIHGELDDVVDPEGSVVPMTRLGVPGRDDRPYEADHLPRPDPRRVGPGLHRQPGRRHLHVDARIQPSLT